MRRLKVVYTEDANDELKRLYTYLREHGAGISIARGYILRLRRSCELIGDAPEGGRQRNDLEEGLRTWPFERRCLIGYKVVNGRVVIGNFFYGGRDVDSFFKRDRPPPPDTP